jgi:tripartite-type tricarboxylate transporter receptor subunit TctC
MLSIPSSLAAVGSVFFTTCLLLNSILDAKPTLVPFNGGGPAMNAVIGGQVDYMCADVALAGHYCRGLFQMPIAA